MPSRITKRQQAFLNAYSELGFVHGAALQADVSRELHDNALRVSKPDREAFSEIEQIFPLNLEEEARRIAVQGNPEPIYYGRKIVGYRNRPSDKLLIFLLQANNPEKFLHPFRRRKKRKPDSRAISRRASTGFNLVETRPPVAPSPARHTCPKKPLHSMHRDSKT